MPAPIPIGIDAFRELRENGLEYVDKTRLIKDILDMVGTKVLLLPRPRRFGKTVNMTMLEAFLARSSEDLSHLFEGLHIWSAGEAYRAHFQRYPTIFLSFKNVKPDSEEAWQQGLQQKLSQVFLGCSAQLKTDLLAPVERMELEQLIEKRADPALQEASLQKLSEWLRRTHGEQVLILVDEYDTPIHAAWKADRDARRSREGIHHFRAGEPGGCYAHVVKFFQAFFGAALKGNPHLFKGILTGILRVSKESIFSDLNNPEVRTLLDHEFADTFGFTEDEVQALCQRQEQLQHLPVIQTWYNGYRFGGKTIYNPWSVLYFLKSMDKTPQSYWLNSSSNDLVKELIMKRGMQAHETFQTLLEGGAIHTKIEPNLAFPELEHSQNALLTMLLFSGYLKAEQQPTAPGREAEWAVSIPNLEVRKVYETTFSTWLEQALGGYGEQTARLLKALLTGDEAQLERLLGRMARQMLSYFDTNDEPEALYHGLMLGLCAALEPDYRVRSNRESGNGRPDLMILPTRAGQAGAVLELKVAYGGRRTLEQALAEGEEQLRKKQYETEVEACGADPVQRWAVAFDGKEVRVKLCARDNE